MACTAEYFLIDAKIFPTKEFEISELEKGISIYEVVKLINGTPLFLDDHLKRLHYSAKIKRKSIWVNNEYIEKQVFKIIKINSVINGRLKFALRFHKSGNKLICFFLEKIEPKPEVYKKGVKIISKVHERINPNAKVINYDLRKKVKSLIKKKKAFETLLINNFGKVTECSKSNIFFIKGDTVYTPSSTDVLIGITRNHVFDICKKAKIKIVETDILYINLNKFDSAFISGTSIGILGINKIDKYIFSLENQILNEISTTYNSIVDTYMKKNSS